MTKQFHCHSRCGLCHMRNSQISAMILIEQYSLFSQILICRITSILHKSKYVLASGPTPFKVVDTYGKRYRMAKLDFWFYFHSFLVFIAGIQSLRKESKSSMENVLASITLLGQTICACHIYIKQTKPSEIALYFNSLFRFRWKHRHLWFKKYTSLERKMSVLFIRCSTISIVLFPCIAVYGLH